MINKPLPKPAILESLPQQATRYPITPLVIARLLLAMDLMGLLICISLVYGVRSVESFSFSGVIDLILSGSVFSWVSIPFSGFLFVYFFCLYLANTYRLSNRLLTSLVIIRVCLSVIISSVLTASLSAFNVRIVETNDSLILPVSIILFMIWAIVLRLIALRFLQRTQDRSCWLILGNCQDKNRSGNGYNQSFSDSKFFHFLEDLKSSGDSFKATSIDQLSETLRDAEYEDEQHWSGVIIEDPKQHLSDDVVKTLMRMRLRGIYVYSLENYYEKVWYKIPPILIEDDWFAFTSGFSLFHNRINVKLKRMMDLVVTTLVFLLVLPLMVVVAIAIKLDSKGPIFYSQVRTGLNSKPFRVHKFRSMFTDAEKKGAQWSGDSDSRVTRVGKIIRRLSVDELPQLWNVLQGEMSLIGPRPERPEFDRHLEQEIPYYNIRYLVRPGITGWYQVNSPYASSVEDAYQKVSYDLYYIKNYSFLLDLAIVFKTLRVVVLGRG